MDPHLCFCLSRSNSSVRETLKYAHKHECERKCLLWLYRGSVTHFRFRVSAGTFFLFAEKSSINVLAYELKQILQLTNISFKAHPLCVTGIEL